MLLSNSQIFDAKQHLKVIDSRKIVVDPDHEPKKCASGQFIVIPSWYPKQPLFYVMIWNHPIETTIKKIAVGSSRL